MQMNLANVLDFPLAFSLPPWACYSLLAWVRDPLSRQCQLWASLSLTLTHVRKWKFRKSSRMLSIAMICVKISTCSPLCFQLPKQDSQSSQLAWLWMRTWRFCRSHSQLETAPAPRCNQWWVFKTWITLHQLCSLRLNCNCFIPWVHV